MIKRLFKWARLRALERQRAIVCEAFDSTQPTANPRQLALETARQDRLAASQRYLKAARSKAKRDMGEASRDLEAATRRVLWLEGVR